MAGLQTEQRGWRSSKFEFILFVGDNCKSNIGREGDVVSVSKGLQHDAAAAALSGIEMAGKSVQRALVTQQGGGGQGKGKGFRAEKALTFYLLKRRRFYFLAHTCGQPE
jgi:hypothetical protein